MSSPKINMAASLKAHPLLRPFTHPWMPTAMYTPIGILLTGFSLSAHPHSLTTVLLFIFLGIFAWTFIEYLLHRFVFHLTRVKEPWRSLASGLHMAHHRTMNAEDLIIAPPLVSFIYSFFLYFIFALITQSFSLGAFMATGLIIGYVAYEWAHYGSHRFRPKSRIGKYLKDYHLLHHYKYPNDVFGVTNPFWDLVFGTYAKNKPAKT